MNQYAIANKSSQEDQQVSEQVAQQLQRFVHPFLDLLDAYGPRDAQRVEESGEDGLPCGLKVFCSR